MTRDLHRVAADPAGRAHHNEALIRGNAEQLERPERSYCRDGQRGCLFISDAIGDTGQRWSTRPGHRWRIRGCGHLGSQGEAPGAGSADGRRSPPEVRWPWRSGSSMDHR
jgi:hypothetical protein